MEDVERARLQLRAEEGGGRPRRVLGLDDERARRRGQRVEPERDPSDQRERPGRAADELAQVVAGDVLDDLPAGVGDRPVGEHERDAEDEVARRAEAMPERTGQVGRQAGADGRVAGRVERESLAVLGERRLERGEAHAGLDDARQVSRLVLEDAIEPLRRQVGADPDATALGVRRRRGRPQPPRG